MELSKVVKLHNCRHSACLCRIRSEATRQCPKQAERSKDGTAVKTAVRAKPTQQRPPPEGAEMESICAHSQMQQRNWY